MTAPASHPIAPAISLFRTRASTVSPVRRRCVKLVGLLLAAVLGVFSDGVRAPASAQGDTGDVLGDLVHIKRDPSTGQPILQKRWVDLEGVLGWAYCPIPVDVTGGEIPFVALACDPDPAYADALIEVDYFGRLSAGRTKERNQRMHFDETIDGIKSSGTVMLDDAGRLRLGSDCTSVGVCASWRTIDSPMENMALYQRILKYGHIQTDPLEVDTSSGGDPSAGTIYHPALGDVDWAKFTGPVTALLPRPSSSECFTGSAFDPACAAPQALTSTDFFLAGAVLSGAADKTGHITPDLVQYPEPDSEDHRDHDAVIGHASHRAGAHPRRRRDHCSRPGRPDVARQRTIRRLRPGRLPHSTWYAKSVSVLQPSGASFVPTNVDLTVWLNLMNGPMAAPATAMPGFIASSSDALRVVEFIHEYQIPADLWVNPAATATTVAPATASYSALAQMVTLSASVTSQSLTPVSGLVTFYVRTAASVTVGVPTPAVVTNGVATVPFVLPADVAAQTLTVVALFTSTGPFASSLGTGTLTIVPEPPPPPPPVPVSADIDGNGHPDLVWEGADGRVYTWFMDGTVLISGAYLSTTPVDPAWQVVGTSDLTGDGKPDLLWQNQVTGQVNIVKMDGLTKLGEQAVAIAHRYAVAHRGHRGLQPGWQGRHPLAERACGHDVYLVHDLGWRRGELCQRRLHPECQCRDRLARNGYDVANRRRGRLQWRWVGRHPLARLDVWHPHGLVYERRRVSAECRPDAQPDGQHRLAGSRAGRLQRGRASGSHLAECRDRRTGCMVPAGPQRHRSRGSDAIGRQSGMAHRRPPLVRAVSRRGCPSGSLVGNPFGDTAPSRDCGCDGGRAAIDGTFADVSDIAAGIIKG